MRLDRRQTNCALLSRRVVHQTDNARMLAAECHSQLAEVLVERDHGARFSQRDSKNLVVPRYLRQSPTQKT